MIITREMEEARARLEAYKDKIKPYPAYPVEEPPDLVPDLEWDKRQWDKIQQLQAEIRGWRTKHALALKEISILKAKVDRAFRKDDI